MIRTSQPAGHPDLIWNITLICAWDCEFCCTDAVQVTRHGNLVQLREQGLGSRLQIDTAEEHHTESGDDTISLLRSRGIEPSPFDFALASRQRRGLELTYRQKLAVLDNLRPHQPKIDFAGGDPLACYENMLVIEQAAKYFSRSNIAVTVTGAGLGRFNIAQIASTIGQFEFTYDEPKRLPAHSRPRGYNGSNLLRAADFARAGVRTKAQTPLHRLNTDTHTIASLYSDLTDAGIEEVLLMRTFPVGRGMVGFEKQWMLDASQLRRAIEVFRNEEVRLRGPRVRLQCALRFLEPLKDSRNPCDLMRESFGINPKGQLLLSAWATNSHGAPLDDAFLLGELHSSTFDSLINSAKARSVAQRLDRNFGHCKIFAFMFGAAGDPESMFAKTDPIYAVTTQDAARRLDTLYPQ